VWQWLTVIDRDGSGWRGEGGCVVESSEIELFILMLVLVLALTCHLS
jgi:hypothetical protein